MISEVIYSTKELEKYIRMSQRLFHWGIEIINDVFQLT